MAVLDTATALPQLLDQLTGTAALETIAELFAQTPELRQSSIILQIADSVNQIAREDLSRAERLAAAGSVLADLLGDNYCRARLGRASGNVLVLRGKYSEALEVFQKALELFQGLGDQPEEAATLSASLQPLIYLGRYSEAFDRAQAAHRLAEAHHNELLSARLKINFGNIFHRQDRFEEAVEHYRLALATLERLEQYRDCAIAWANLAVCHISLNDFREAEVCYKKARSISDQQNMPLIAAQADYNIAYLHYYRGEHNLAIHLYQHTRRYCESVGDQYHAALCDLDQAEMYLELHLAHEGAELAQQAFASFEKTGMGYEGAKALAFLGIAAYQDRKNFQALDFLADAQGRLRKEQNQAWVALLGFYQALILRQEGRYFEALRHCKAAQSFYADYPDSGKAVLIQCLRASLHLEIGDPEAANTWARNAAISAEILDSPILQMHAYWILGRVHEATQSGEAYDLYRTALQFLETIPSRLKAEELKIPFGQNRLELYEALLSLTPLAGSSLLKPEVVFEFIEKAKTRELSDLIAFRSNTVPASAKGRSSLAEQVRVLREELNWYYRQVNKSDLQSVAPATSQTLDMRRSIRERENTLVKTLDELHVTDEEFHSLQTASAVSLERVRGVLAADEMILEFSMARGFIYVCLVRRNSTRVMPVTTVERGRALLAALEEQWSKCRVDSDYLRKFPSQIFEGARNALTGLYDELIRPLAGQLKNDRLIVVPDGFLHYLPFHAFSDGTCYLGEKHLLSYASSASLYCLAMAKEPVTLQQDLIFAASTAPNKAGGIAQDLAAVLPDAKSFSNSEPLSTALEAHAGGCRFLHIDTALRRREDNLLLSTISIGGTELSLLDIFNLRLPCSMLSLSGAGPGLQASGKGSEITLLSRALQYAGAQTVLLPLWNVGGAASNRFITSFYRVADSEPDKAFAFQRACAEVRREFPLPYYWANFTLRAVTRRPHGDSRDSRRS